jgi:NAD(P)-dependent dehydrogenase (short-subunit alcohol dehydrogenase family)
MKNSAIIIGGSSGIGNSICNVLKDDYEVVNFSRRYAKGIKNIRTDVTDNKSIQKSFFTFYKEYGIPSAMVYSAGFVEPQGLLEIDKQNFDRTLKTCFSGAVFSTQEFVKLAKDIGGKIIYISSTAGSRPEPAWSIYAASKSALNNFALSVSESVKEYNIKIYIISPGRCATSLRRKMCQNEDQRLIMQPIEIANFVKYIIKEDTVLNGQIIEIKRR